jgi:hypothetical protein
MHAGSAVGWNVAVSQPIDLKSGKNSIDLLCMTLGLQVRGIPKRSRGLRLLILYHKRLKNFLVEFSLKY